MERTVLDHCLWVLRGQPSSERFAVLAGEVPMGPTQSGRPRSQIMRITCGEVYQVGFDHTFGEYPKSPAEIAGQAHGGNLK